MTFLPLHTPKILLSDAPPSLGGEEDTMAALIDRVNKYSILVRESDALYLLIHCVFQSQHTDLMSASHSFCKLMNDRGQGFCCVAETDQWVGVCLSDMLHMYNLFSLFTLPSVVVSSAVFTEISLLMTVCMERKRMCEVVTFVLRHVTIYFVVRQTDFNTASIEQVIKSFLWKLDRGKKTLIH